MSTELRIWLGVVLSGLIICAVAVADLFHFHMLGANADEILLASGTAIIAGKSVFDLGVLVPGPNGTKP